MSRKKWTPNKDAGPEILIHRTRKRWQIALRRYLLEKIPSFEYAPFFGLDITNFRRWIEIQFHGEQSWDNFSTRWQFDHIIPVSIFDFSKESDLRLCWHFINIKISTIKSASEPARRLDLVAARRYFEVFYLKTNYSMALQMVERIDKVDRPLLQSSQVQDEFIKLNRDYLRRISNFSAFEFDQLNYGVPIPEILAHRETSRKYE